MSITIMLFFISLYAVGFRTRRDRSECLRIGLKRFDLHTDIDLKLKKPKLLVYLNKIIELIIGININLTLVITDVLASRSK